MFPRPMVLGSKQHPRTAACLRRYWPGVQECNGYFLAQDQAGKFPCTGYAEPWSEVHKSRKKRLVHERTLQYRCRDPKPSI